MLDREPSQDWFASTEIWTYLVVGVQLATAARPFVDSGALKARRQQALEAAVASSARYQQIVLTAFAQVADALSALPATTRRSRPPARVGATRPE